MLEIELPIFGKIKLTEEDSEYKYQARKWKYSFKETPIDLDVHFKEINAPNTQEVASALNNLTSIHKTGKNAFQKDFQEGETVKEYIEEWKEDIFLQIFNEAEFKEFISDTDKEKSIAERLLSKIRIVRIGIYAESENSFIIMDFAFGYDHNHDKGFREDMIVVSLNPNLEVTDICTEG